MDAESSAVMTNMGFDWGDMAVERCIEFEDQYQRLCHAAQLGGAATLDELAEVMRHLTAIAEYLDDLTKAVFKLQDAAKEAPNGE